MPGWPTGSARGSPRTSPTTVAGQPAARPCRRHPAAPGDHRAGPRRRSGPARGRRSACARPARRCWSPAARRAPAGSTRRSPPRPAGSLAAGVQVLHVVGPRNEDQLRPAERRPTSSVPYVDRMDLAYAAADLMLCRAGAMTCAEVAAVGLPAIYVPLPIGNGEQRLNALPVVDAGGGLLVADADLTPDGWSPRPCRYLTAPDRLAAAAAAARTHGAPDAAARARVPRPAGCRWHPADAEGGTTMTVEPDGGAVLAGLGAVHFVGIGGAGMSGIARILLARGVRVSRQRRQGLPPARRAARARRPGPRRPRRRHARRRRRP